MMAKEKSKTRSLSVSVETYDAVQAVRAAMEMAGPCKCCGHGGSFNVSHYDLSTDISHRKVESILASGADILVTECSGCLIQLAEATGRQRPGFNVITTPEALFLFKFDKPKSPP